MLPSTPVLVPSAASTTLFAGHAVVRRVIIGTVIDHSQPQKRFSSG
jgi:hypothetical protein